MKKQKKGQIITQFNWIFIAVAGGIILLFFFAVVNKQKDLSEQKLATTVISDLEAITTGAGVSQGTAQSVNIPDLEISMQCPGCLCTFAIGNIKKNFRDKIIFSPSRLKGNKLIAWTLSWDVPFRVSNFLYLTTEQVRYIFWYDVSDEDAKVLVDELPELLLKEETTAPSTFSVNNNNNYKVRIISFNNKFPNINSLRSMSNEDVTLLQVNLASKTLSFYNKKEINTGSTTKNYDYLTESEIYAAIFADSAEMYKCNLEKAFKRLSTVSTIYLNRSLELHKAYLANPGQDYCHSGFYLPSENRLDTLSYEAGNLALDLSYGVNILENPLSKLKKQNTNAELYSCPEIY